MEESSVSVRLNIFGDDNDMPAEAVQDYLERFGDINTLLGQCGLPEHDEPTCTIQWDAADYEREYHTRFPLSCLAYLKRAYAEMKWNVNNGYPAGAINIAPIGPEGVAYYQTTVDWVLRQQVSHLCCHAPNAGVYLPIAGIKYPLDSSMNSSIRIPGRIIGSSIGLLEELLEVAPCIGIQLDPSGRLPSDEAKRLYDISEGTTFHPFMNEYCAWLTLHEVAELSMDYRTAVVLNPW